MIRVPRDVQRSLHTKLVRMVVLVLLAVTTSTLAAVAVMQFLHSEDSREDTEALIGEVIETKGAVVSENHALAMAGFVDGNSFGAVQDLVWRTIQDDEDVVYGLFLDLEGNAWAYVSPSHQDREPSEAWKELDIPPESIVAPTSSRREMRLFEQDILEFTSVVQVDNEVLGSVRYGLSTKRADAAIEVAREAAVASLIRTLVLLAVLGVVTTFLGVFISRRQASRITEPLATLTNAARELAHGDRDVTVQIDSDDELEVLGHAFNDMVGQLNESYGELEGLNARLEQIVASRTAALKSRNENMRLVMDNCVQGFFTCTPAGMMSLERSAVVDLWLGRYDEPQLLPDYLERLDPEFGDLARLGLQQLEDGFLPPGIALRQMPTRLKTGGRVLDFEFLAVVKDDVLENVLVAISDVTAKLARETSESRERETLEIFSRAGKNRAAFEDFADDATAMVEQITSGDLGANMVVLRRVVHTLKGNCALMGLETISRICHGLEDSMEANSGPASAPLLEGLGERWSELSDVIDDLLGARGGLRIPDARYAELLSSLETLAGASALHDEVLRWQLSPLQDALVELGDKARILGGRLEKGDIEVHVESGGIQYERSAWSPVLNELVHVVRNSVVHGFADPVAMGRRKPRIELLASSDETCFRLQIRDNGRGIDWEALRRKAKTRGLATETQDDLVEALFADGLSTQSFVSEEAGRGVGLSAVRARCLAVGGSISVESEPDKGTLFSFEFPARLLQLRVHQGDDHSRRLGLV